MRREIMILLVLTFVTVTACAGNKPETTPEVTKKSLPIRVVQFPGQTLLIRKVTGPFSEMSNQINDFINFLAEQDIRTTGDLGGALFDNPAVTPPEETRYEIRIPVEPGTVATAPYEVIVTEPMSTAAVLLLGDYESIARFYPDIYAWIDENGYVPAGPLMEIYLEHPGSGAAPEDYETEVHVPVMPK